MNLLLAILIETWLALYLAAPFLLLGLIVAGVTHVLLPQRLIVRWMGGQGLSAVARAAFVGIPLPVCSCGVVPIATELRRKGASVPATTSFLITTPETSAESIFLTWGLMGPVIAVARPVASFFTAMIAGVMSIAQSVHGKTASELCPVHGDGSAHSHDHHDHDHDHDDHDHTHVADDVTTKQTREDLRVWWDRRVLRRAGEDAPKSLTQILWKPAFRYAFGPLLGDLAFWLLLGLLAAGVIGAFVPDDLTRYGLGAGFLPLILALIVGIPMYTCASASTPVAAALLAKGLSPGAALVFLLVGPATNTATLLMLGKLFGRKFLVPYLASIAVGALLCGWFLDKFLLFGDISVISRLLTESTQVYGPLGWIFAVILLALCGWRLYKGRLGKVFGMLLGTSSDLNKF